MARRPPGQLRSAILDATMRLLEERQDPALVSVDAVVTSVGCTPPALYYYFPTKDHLLWEACQRQYAAFAADLESMTTHSDDAMADLRARGVAYLTWAREHPAAYHVLFMTRLDLVDPTGGAADSGEPPDFGETPGLDGLVRDLRRAQAAGVAVGDATVTAFALWAVVHGFASLSITNPDIPADFLLAGFERATVGMFSGPAA